MSAIAAPINQTMLRHPLVKAALLGLLIAGLGYALFRSWSDLGAVEWQFQPLPVALAFLMLFTVIAGLAPLWVLVCRSLGGELPMRAGVRVYLISNIGKYVPGKVVHAVGRVVMLQDHQVPTAVSVTSILIELALSLLGAFLVSLFSLPLLLEHQLGFLIPLALVAVPIGLATLHPAILGRLLQLGIRFIPGTKGELSQRLPSYGMTLKLLGGHVAAWAVMSVALFVTALSVYSLEPIWLPAMCGIAAVSYLFGLAVPIAPSGIGAREGLMTLLLSTFMPLPAAAAASVLYRTLGILADALAAAIASRL